MDVASILIALVVHDLDYLGRTNPFLHNSKHTLAFQYMDSSILESHHVATAHNETSLFHKSNIFQNLEEYVTVSYIDYFCMLLLKLLLYFMY